MVQDEFDDKAKKVNEKAETVREQVEEKVEQVKQKARTITVPTADVVASEYVRKNQVEISTVLQFVTAVAVVGILINNKRSFKFTKRVIKNMDKNAENLQKVIVELKDAGRTFEFFPGVGVWVD